MTSAPDPAAPPVTTPSKSESELALVGAALGELLAVPSSRLTAVRRRLAGLPADAVTEVLRAALEQQTDWRLYLRIATSLGRTPTAEAINVLKAEAQRYNRFPRLAIRALAGSGAPRATAALLRLLGDRRKSIRRSAGQALARMGNARAIEPLCRMATNRNGNPDASVRQALGRFGRPRQMLRRLLADDTMRANERLAALEAMEVVPRLLGRQGVQQHLDREAGDTRSPCRARAEEAAQLYRDRKTLLRPSRRTEDETLVRPAAGVGTGDPTTLLRPSDNTGCPQSEAPQSVLRSLWDRVRDIFDGD